MRGRGPRETEGGKEGKRERETERDRGKERKRERKREREKERKREREKERKREKEKVMLWSQPSSQQASQPAIHQPTIQPASQCYLLHTSPLHGTCSSHSPLCSVYACLPAVTRSPQLSTKPSLITLTLQSIDQASTRDYH